MAKLTLTKITASQKQKNAPENTKLTLTKIEGRGSTQSAGAPKIDTQPKKKSQAASAPGTSSNGYIPTAALRQETKSLDVPKSDTLPTATKKAPVDGLAPSQRMGLMAQLTPVKRAVVANEPTKVQSTQASQRAAELELQVKQLKAQKVAVQAGPSSYAQGGGSTPSGVPYAARLQQTTRDQDAETKLQALQAELTQAKHELAGQSYAQRRPRLLELATMSTTPTASERAEMQAGIQYLEQYLEPRMAALRKANGGDLTTEMLKGTQEEDASAILGALRKKNPDTVRSSFFGAVSSIPFMGSYFRYADQVAKDSAIGDGKKTEWDILPRGTSELADMRAAHPLAYGLSKGAGDLATMIMGGEALKSIPAIASLGPIAQNVVTSGTLMGARGANDAATEGAGAGEIVKQGAIGAAAGAAGGGASGLAGSLGTQALFKLGLQNDVLPNAINQGISGAAFSGGNMATRKLLDPDYNPTTQEVLTEAGVAFLFSTISSAINMHGQTKAAKAQLDYDLAKVQDDYATIFLKKARGELLDEQALVELEVRTQQLRETLNSTQYVGHGEEVKEALDALDAIDDSINAVWQGLSGSNPASPADGASAGGMGLPLSSMALPAAGEASTPGAPVAPTTPDLPTATSTVAADLPTAATTLKTAPTIRNRGEAASVVQKLKENTTVLNELKPVAQVSSSVVNSISGNTMAEKARVLFAHVKGLVTRPGFGDVEITDQSARDDLSHGVGPAKAAVIPAIPEVIRSGKQIEFREKWKGRPYDGYIFAAPVKMDERTVFVAAVVKQTTKNHFYLHEVVDSDGNIIKMGNGDGANQTSLAASGDAGTLSPLLENSIPQNAQGVNPSAVSELSTLPTATDRKTLPTARTQMRPAEELAPLDADTGSDEYWDSLIQTREAPLEPMSDDWLDDLVMNGERGYVPKTAQTATEMAVAQGLEEDTTPRKPQHITAEEVEAEGFTEAMDTLSKKLLKDYDSKADPQGIGQGLQAIFERMGAEGGLSQEELTQETQALAQQILQRVEVKNTELYQGSKEIRGLIKQRTIHVPPEVASNFPDYADFRKRNFGRMTLSATEGREIDDLFAELANYDAGSFDQDAVPNPADQLAKISDYLDSVQPTTENPYASGGMDEASGYLAKELEDTLRRLDSRRRALRMAASVREAREAFFASMGPDPDGPEPVATVLNELPTAKETVREQAKELGRTFYRAMVDTGETVDRIGKATGDKSLYAYYNYARASSSAAQNMIARGGYQADIWGRKVGPSLGDIFSPIREKGDAYYNDFQMYLLHSHNVDRMSRYNPAAVDIAQADFDAFQRDHPEISGLSQVEIQGWADQGDFFAQTYLQLQRELSKAQNTRNKPVFGEDVDAEASRAEADRLIREHPEFGELAQSVYQYSRNLLQYQVDSQLMTPEDMEQILDIYPHYVPTYRVTDGDTRALKKAGLKISKVLGRATGGNADVVPIHVAMARQTMRVVRNGSANRFASRLMTGHFKHKGATSDYIRKVQKTASLIHPDTFDLQEDPTPKMQNTFTVYQDGEALTVTADKGLLDAMSVLTGESSSTMDLAIWKPFQALNSMFKSLVTGYNPMFSARNFARDLQEAGLYSKDLAAWAKAYPKAVREIATNGELWQRYQALGGVWSSVFDYNKGYREADKEHGRLRKLTLDKVDAFNLGVEQAPRFAEFIAQLEKNGDTPDGIMDAMHAAANVTTNFGRSGKVGAFLNKTFVPFLNPGIQGLDKMAKTFFGKKTGREWLRLAAVCAILGIAPMALNEALNHDAPNWEDIRDSDKDTYWLIHIGDGKYLRIPKGRDISVVNMAVNRAGDALRGEKVELGDTLATAANQIAPANPLENNILAAWFDADLFDPESPGKTWYGGNIESDRLQRYAPGERYDEKTDAISKAVGGALNISPKKINYILDQYTGVVGDFALPIMTPAGDKNPLSPFVKSFVLDSATSNRVSGEFYDTIDQLEYAENSGDGSKAVTSRFMSKQSKVVSDLNKQIREIENSSMPSKEKVEKVRELKIAITGIQKNAMEVLPSYEEAVKKYYTGDDDEELAVTYREANREVFGAEYALQMESKTVYAKAQEANKLGASYESYYAAYVKLKGQTTKRDKQKALQKCDIPDDERNAIYSVLDGKDSYTKFKEAGLTSEEAQKTAWAVENLLPDYGKTTVSDAQKWRAVVDCKLAGDKTLKSLQQLMDETQYAKLDAACACGVSVSAYVTFQEELARAANKNQDTVKKILDGIAMEDKDRAVLWQMANTGWTSSNNPYNRPMGKKAVEIYAEKKAKK